MHTDTHTTDALLDDILDPNLSAPAICRAHNITLAQLIEFLQGPDFQQLTEATHLLSQSRTKLLALDIAPRAMQALDQSTETNEESRLLNETIRKSATKLLTIARQSTKGTHRFPHVTDGDINAANGGAHHQSPANETIHPCQSEAAHRPIPSPACRRSAEGGAKPAARHRPNGGVAPTTQPPTYAPHPSPAISIALRNTPVNAITSIAGSARPANPAASHTQAPKTPP